MEADRRLRHRGPDGCGAYADPHCELVHRRLALIDLSPTGHQPLSNEDQRVFVVFNGEIYNHFELRHELQARGHIFRGTSDTEVLVHLYEEVGDGLAERLHGMFAFAIYDRAQRRLVLARDRFGIKPLYYAALPGQHVFASEMKALLALTGFTPSLDRQACYDFLGLGYVPEPATAFREIQAVERGSTLVLSTAGVHRRRFAKTVPNVDAAVRLDDAVEQASEALRRAVTDQRVADVQVGALLSGGIDSSLVVAATSKDALPPQTFNVRFPDAGYDETEVARLVASHCRTEHQTIDLSDYSVTPESIVNLLGHFDQPFADTSLIPMYWVSKAIRDRGIICALSGDGGDEAFGGYARFWRLHRLVQLMQWPTWLQQTVASVSARVTHVTEHFGRQASKAVRLAQAGRHDSAVLLAGLSNYLSEEQKVELMSAGDGRALAPVYRHFGGHQPPGTSSLEELSRRMTENLFSVGLVSDMLRKVDMMSMLAGIEVRVPMLDERLVSIGLRLPHRLKTDGTKGKLVLRALAARWLPAEVAEHRKHGFGIPLDRVATTRFHELLADTLLAPTAKTHGLLNPKVIEAWLLRFRTPRAQTHGGELSREGLYQRIVIVLALEHWMQTHKLAW